MPWFSGWRRIAVPLYIPKGTEYMENDTEYVSVKIGFRGPEKKARKKKAAPTAPRGRTVKRKQPSARRARPSVSSKKNMTPIVRQRRAGKK